MAGQSRVVGQIRRETWKGERAGGLSPCRVRACPTNSGHRVLVRDPLRAKQICNFRCLYRRCGMPSPFARYNHGDAQGKIGRVVGTAARDRKSRRNGGQAGRLRLKVRKLVQLFHQRVSRPSLVSAMRLRNTGGLMAKTKKPKKQTATKTSKGKSPGISDSQTHQPFEQDAKRRIGQFGGAGEPPIRK